MFIDYTAHGVCEVLNVNFNLIDGCRGSFPSIKNLHRSLYLEFQHDFNWKTTLYNL